MNYKFRVPFSYVDESLNMSYYNACILISDMVCDFLACNNFDNSIFSKTHNALWVVLKNKIIINNIAKYKDDLEIEVSYIDIKKLYTTIKVLVKKESSICYEAYVCLAAVNSTSHNILDISNMNILKLTENGYNLYSRFKNNIDDYEKYKEVKPIKRDIDYSRHVNNLVYIRWLLDLFNELGIKNICNIEIHYLHEIKSNDNVSIYLKKEENSVYFMIYTTVINAKGKVVL